jgi:hypothetical protein
MRWYSEGWKLYTSKQARQPSSEVLLDHISHTDVGTGQDWVYDGFQADFTDTESTICASNETREKRREEECAWFEMTSR